MEAPHGSRRPRSAPIRLFCLLGAFFVDDDVSTTQRLGTKNTFSFIQTQSQCLTLTSQVYNGRDATWPRGRPTRFGDSHRADPCSKHDQIRSYPISSQLRLISYPFQQQFGVCERVAARAVDLMLRRAVHLLAALLGLVGVHLVVVAREQKVGNLPHEGSDGGLVTTEQSGRGQGARSKEQRSRASLGAELPWEQSSKQQSSWQQSVWLRPSSSSV